MLQPLTGVSYDAGSQTATLSSDVLDDDLYRLLVCAALTDEAGNALDGDGDAVNGDDFERNFRIADQNLLRNGDLDCDLVGWTASNPASVSHVLIDVDGSPESGAARIFNQSFTLEQCIAAPAAPLGLEASLRLEQISSDVTLTAHCDLYDQTDCAGTLLSTLQSSSTFSSTGTWSALSPDFAAVASTASASCRFELSSEGLFEALLDRLELVIDPTFFEDSFERGNTEAWDEVCPPDCPPIKSLLSSDLF